jgi:hypothetical protein
MKRSYSRRELYALGEPLGDSATYRKAGGLVLGDGGGGGGGQAAAPDKTTQVSELPEWARPYAKDTLAKGAALTDINQNPYQQYGGNRIAGFSPLQQMSFQGAANMQPSQQVGMGSDLAAAAGIGALGTNYQAGRFGGGMFGQGAADFYMNPYQQNVTDIGKREAARQSAIQGTQQQAQATQAGAFGGGRDAIMRAERERNLGQQMSDIQAQGSNAAYTNAQQQFNADQARRMQAQQLGEQSRQYGAGLGMQGLQTALQGAGQLGQLGGQQFQQGMDINKLQSAYGGQMQQQAQRPLDMAYQDFQNQQNYPYKQLGFMSDLIRGLPLGQQSTSQMYQGSGNTMGQLAGLGMGAYGVSQLMKAEGGTVHDYAEGGVTSDQNVEGILSKLSDQQLQQAKQGALARRDVDQVNMIDAEISMRASARNGIGAAITPEFADQMEEGMATGGIVAFADRGAVKEMPEKATSSIGDFLEKIGVSDAVNSLRESYYKSRETEKRREGAEDILPGITEAITPTERARRKAVGSEMFSSEPKSVKKMTPQEIEAANAAITGSSKPAAKPADDTVAAPNGSAPKVGVNEPPKPAPAKSLDRKYADISSGSKPSKAEVKSAVSQFADQKGATPAEKEDYMATALKIREELGKQNQPILDKLNEAISAQKPNEQALKDRGIAQALTQFGFGLAERASKPGARFLESAAGASPVLASVAEKTNTLIDTQKQNYTNLKLDQAKYEVALAKGDMSTAAALAGQIRQANQQDQMLKFQIAKAQDELALKREEFALKERELANQRNYQGQMASRYETVGSLTKDIMQNEGLSYGKALEKAGNILKPSGFAATTRADSTTRAALAKELGNVEDKYPAIQRAGSSKLAKASQAAYENAINNVYKTFEMEPPRASGASAGGSRLPSGVTVTEIGR